MNSGGDRGTQTLDFFHAMEVLYQLSYIPLLCSGLQHVSTELYPSMVSIAKTRPCIQRRVIVTAVARPPGALFVLQCVCFAAQMGCPMLRTSTKVIMLFRRKKYKHIGNLSVHVIVGTMMQRRKACVEIIGQDMMM